mmetsp:Transcript_11685/g.22233  ORF Transcript_11685/g.22233 Transcript_11685/m.22233 type:complete len:230 (+) Transcript_11685:464-1153(+)
MASSSAVSSNMLSCSALCCKINRCRSFFNWSDSSSISSGCGTSSMLLLLCSGLSSISSSPSICVSVFSNPLRSPRFTHLAISASRRSRLSCTFRSTSSSSSTPTMPSGASPSLSPSAAGGAFSISSRQAALVFSEGLLLSFLPRTASGPVSAFVSSTGSSFSGSRSLLRDRLCLRGRSSPSRFFFSFLSLLPLCRFSSLGGLRPRGLGESLRRFDSPYPDIIRQVYSTA